MNKRGSPADGPGTPSTTADKTTGCPLNRNQQIHFRLEADALAQEEFSAKPEPDGKPPRIIEAGMDLLVPSQGRSP